MLDALPLRQLGYPGRGTRETLPIRSISRGGDLKGKRQGRVFAPLALLGPLEVKIDAQEIVGEQHLSARTRGKFPRRGEKNE